MPEEVIREKGTAALGDEKEAIYREIYAPEIEPMPGLVALLDKLRDAGIRCAVGSSGCRANVDFVLEKCDIESFFDAKINGDMVTRCKPDPEIYLTAAAALGLAPAECVVFEDAKAGHRVGTAGRRGPHRRAGVHALPPNAGRRNRRRRHHRRLPRHHRPRNIAEISARPRKRPPQFPTDLSTVGIFLSGPLRRIMRIGYPSQKPDPRKRPASCPSRPLCNLLSITFPLLLPDSGFGRPTQIFPRSGYRTEIFDTFAGFLTRTHICSKESPPSFCSSYRTPS